MISKKPFVYAPPIKLLYIVALLVSLVLSYFVLGITLYIQSVTISHTTKYDCIPLLSVLAIYNYLHLTVCDRHLTQSR